MTVMLTEVSVVMVQLQLLSQPADGATQAQNSCSLTVMSVMTVICRTFYTMNRS